MGYSSFCLAGRACRLCSGLMLCLERIPREVLKGVMLEDWASSEKANEVNYKLRSGLLMVIETYISKSRSYQVSLGLVIRPSSKTYREVKIVGTLRDYVESIFGLMNSQSTGTGVSQNSWCGEGNLSNWGADRMLNRTESLKKLCL